MICRSARIVIDLPPSSGRMEVLYKNTLLSFVVAVVLVLSIVAATTNPEPAGTKTEVKSYSPEDVKGKGFSTSSQKAHTRPCSIH